MKTIYRLNVLLKGTKRSRMLENDESFEMKIPTWIPYEEKNLYNVDDFVNQVNESANLGGDYVRRLWIEKVEINDEEDVTSPMSKYVSGDANDVDWCFEADVIDNNVKHAIDVNDIFVNSEDLYGTASEILPSMVNVFGFGNADPAEVVDDIVVVLIGLGYGDTPDKISFD